MDTPPPIEAPFEEESLSERLWGLTEMVPEPIRNVVDKTVTTSVSYSNWVFNKSRTVTWIVVSSASILLLPISFELDRQEYEKRLRMQERSLILGDSELGP